ncbi:hypothetical protein [Haloechinothrix alba]|uniref:hypothetical protein n=1 Tax=Haloechinothrix alba TaxID=664784 RepID=UPI000B76E330|nr:hypothetical protein [Haloechinothrix alba]
MHTTQAEPLPAQDGPGTVHRPPYETGPTGGDSFTVTNVNADAGTVGVAQRNTRQAAFVHCVGNGPMATLEINHTVREAISSVEIHYTEAILTDALVMNAIVTGSSSGWLGHGAALGPRDNANERTGTINIPLRATPEDGETVRIVFGLQTHAGCLPYPVLGLPGSRPVDKGRATFPWVSVG